MQFDPGQLLKSLNIVRDPATVASSLRQKARHSERELAADSDYRNAAAAFKTRLRELVDEWIKSGSNGDIDEPKKRTLRPGHGAFMAQVEWVQWNQPLPRVAPTGEVYFDLNHPINRRAHQDHDDPIGDMKREAVGAFVNLMASPLKYQLAKCDQCSNYYFRKKLRSFYKRGKYFCPGCRSAASATIRTKKKRTEEHAQIVQAAIQALKRWPVLSASTQAKYKTENSYIASNLKKFSKTAKWVTRNIDEIRANSQEVGNGSL
jgi:hypothetical protein